MEADQFYAASLEVAREQTAELRRIRVAIEQLSAAADETWAQGNRTAPAQLALAAAEATNGSKPSSNGHKPAATPQPRTDPFGHELPRGVSWDASGEVWQVDVTLPGRPRRRVRVPAGRFVGHPALGLAEACRVRAVLQGIDTKVHLAAMHPDTARDVASATAP
ncbi:MAG: hypothetical protein IT341_06895 [Chloroflexi bacterium]|nr:hypothetical protein [Chloroflexota bacterium]